MYSYLYLNSLNTRINEIRAIVKLCDPNWDQDVLINLRSELVEIIDHLKEYQTNTTALFDVKV